MNGGLSELGTFAVLLLPGLFLAGVGALLLWLGFRWGRATPPQGLRSVERYLRGLASGREEPHPELMRGDASIGVANAAVDLGRALRDRHGEQERRHLLAGHVIDAVPGRGLMLVDREAVVMQCSDAVARLVGLRSADLEGAPLAALFTVDSWKEFLPRFTASDERARGFTQPLLMQREQAPPLAVVVHASSVEHPPGATVLWVEPDPGADSERDKELAALTRYRAIYEAQVDGVLIVADGVVREANTTAQQWWGSALQGSVLRDLVGAEEMLRLTDRAQRAQRGEAVAPVRCRLVPQRAGLSTRDVEVHLKPLTPGLAALMLRDLTSLRTPYEQLRLQQARLAAVLEAAGDGMALLAPQGGDTQGWRVSLVNRRFAEWVGLEASLLAGALEGDFVALLSSRFVEPAALAAFLEISAQEPGREHRGSFELAGPEARSVELVVGPVVAQGGDLSGRLLVLRDITEHRQTERRLHADAAALGRSREALQRAYEELATVHRDLEKNSTELDRVNRELVELDRARAQLFSEVTHELQTPLVSIRGYTQMILEGRLGKINDEQRRGLEVALRNVDRMVELIQNLLALAKSEGQQPLRAEPVDLDAVVDAVFQRVEGQARRKNVELVRRITAPVKALAERDGLTLVLENLVSNAIKFNRSAGRVVVSVSSNAAGFVTIEVEDTGVGIPEDERARVFERFYRGRTSTGTTGSGIGLATAKNVVERHGGRIEVLPAPSGGTLMRVSWPQSNILVS